MNVLKTTLFLTFLLLITAQNSIVAQTDKELLAELAAEEQEAINALVLYPEDTRKVILDATLHPEALIKMESIQNRSSMAFREIMESLPQKSQQALWDLTRYPGLIHELANRRIEPDKSIETILANYPEVIHKRAKEVDLNHDMPLIVIDELNQSAETAFQTILKEYPSEVQNALQELIALPEVLSILTENIRFTLLVGHVYEKDPFWVMEKADSLHLEVARQNAQEAEDWKSSLENDPEALEELTGSIDSYSEEYGYDDEYYDFDEEEAVYEETGNEVIVRHHYYYNYPYWLGYPYWYDYPRWRYYPRWHDWVFYYYPNRPVVLIGLPSFHFTYWFFHHPHHHQRYSHLSAHFVKHYHGHRRSGSSVSTSVNNWRYQNREVISERWMKDDGRLSKRFKEYGEFEYSREKYNKRNPKKNISRKDYVRKNEKKYPELSKSIKEQRTNKTSRITKNKNDRISTKEKPQKRINPSIDKPKRKVDKPKIKKPAKNKQTTKPKNKKPTTQKQQKENNSRKSPKVKKGKDYHKNSWERSKTKRTKPKSNNRVNRKQEPTRKKSGGE